MSFQMILPQKLPNSKRVAEATRTTVKEGPSDPPLALAMVNQLVMTTREIPSRSRHTFCRF